jgi:hypothetical protein
MAQPRPNSRTKFAAWICPTCGRRFARARQAHSCKPQSIDSHFAGKDPALRDLFDRLLRSLRKTGPLRVDAVKTSINLVSRHHFGGVSVRRDHLRLGFLAKTAISHPRIVRHEPLGPERVGHSVVIRGKKDIDSTLLAWLTDAQRMQS